MATGRGDSRATKPTRKNGAVRPARRAWLNGDSALRLPLVLAHLFSITFARLPTKGEQRGVLGGGILYKRWALSHVRRAYEAGRQH